MKRLLHAFFFLASLSGISQNYEDTWTGHFSYTSIKDISQGDGKIFAASENAIFTYDLATKEIETISTINGLSGEFISTIHYSETHNILVIGYQTGLMEIILEGENNVLRVVDILEKQSIPPDKKRINHFNEHEGKLFISTDYGISVYDLAGLEFGDTYFIGNFGTQIKIAQTTVDDPYIYAATETGIKRATVDNNDLIDYEQWETVATGSFRGIQTLHGEVYALDNMNRILRGSQSGFTVIDSYNAPIVDFQVQHDFLTIVTEGFIRAYSQGYLLEGSVTSLPGYELSLQSGYTFDDVFYLGTKEDGLLEVPFGSNTPVQILPDGPLNNRPFAIDATPGQLWTVFGEVDLYFDPYPLTYIGISNFKENAWTNISYEDLSATVGEINDLVNVATNPDKPEEVYMSSFQKGLLKVENQVPSILYNQTNSPMVIPGNNQAMGLRVHGSAFDRDGNLWFAQARTNKALFKLSPAGQFQAVDISDIIVGPQEDGISKIALSRENYVFLGTSKNGVVGYNPQSNTFNKINEGFGSGNLPNNNVRALAMDKQNRLWIGTLRGLRVLYSPGSFFEAGADTDAQPIIILEDDVAQELLYQQAITDIEVDGSNNKWVATTSSGVFYFSPNGQETLLRFTKENSPLPSNNVLDVAIDPFTGVVYFATLNGLVAYDGSATAPRDNLENVYAFPNPVRPGFTGNVTIDGLTSQANVKITDIEGNLVFEETSEGGSVLWDTSAFGKYKVRSGVYLVLITTEDATETKVAKIMVVR